MAHPETLAIDRAGRGADDAVWHDGGAGKHAESCNRGRDAHGALPRPRIRARQQAWARGVHHGVRRGAPRERCAREPPVDDGLRTYPSENLSAPARSSSEDRDATSKTRLKTDPTHLNSGDWKCLS